MKKLIFVLLIAIQAQAQEFDFRCCPEISLISSLYGQGDRQNGEPAIYQLHAGFGFEAYNYGYDNYYIVDGITVLPSPSNLGTIDVGIWSYSKSTGNFKAVSDCHEYYGYYFFRFLFNEPGEHSVTFVGTVGSDTISSTITLNFN